MERSLELLVELLKVTGWHTGPVKRVWEEPCVELAIAIGRDHSASLTMTRDDLNALLQLAGHPGVADDFKKA